MVRHVVEVIKEQRLVKVIVMVEVDLKVVRRVIFVPLQNLVYVINLHFVDHLVSSTFTNSSNLFKMDASTKIKSLHSKQSKMSTYADLNTASNCWPRKKLTCRSR